MRLATRHVAVGSLWVNCRPRRSRRRDGCCPITGRAPVRAKIKQNYASSGKPCRASPFVKEVPTMEILVMLCIISLWSLLLYALTGRRHATYGTNARGRSWVTGDGSGGDFGNGGGSDCGDGGC